MKFIPCNSNCTADGTHCQGCGRSHEEIAETKRLIGATASFAKKMDYDNHEEFVNAVAKSLLKKLQNPA